MHIRGGIDVFSCVLALTLLFSAFSFTAEALTCNPGEDREECRARLTRDLEAVERQILQQQVLVDDVAAERQSLERDISLLDAEIRKSQLGIQARTLSIGKLEDQIDLKEQTIEELDAKLTRQKESLAQLLRKTNEIDDFSIVEVLLSKEDISGFFEDIDSFQAIKASMQSSFREIGHTKEDTFVERASLEDKQQSEEELRRLQELEKKEIEKKEDEKQGILTVTKGQEAAYQEVLRQNQQTAAQIRAQLFELRDSGSIPFPKALEYAKFAGGKTGVRPALILAVLTQETKLGENIGVVGRWKTDMHPTRDQPIFEYITRELGLDPDSLPVSARPGYGWGGAMGPAQFIPSTWVSYGGFVQDGSGGWVYDENQDRIRAITGKDSPSSPYDNQDAFVASALLMADNGAAYAAPAEERLAALRYFAGWGNASNPSYAFYGDGVMGFAYTYQEQIDILEGG